jgi:uncharacterized SAM-binding protein YcdF (DUF218 family)
MKTFIVVPEGLAQDNEGRYFVSDHYAAALDLVLSIAELKDRIFLAPANSFGAHQEEDYFGRDYLVSKQCPAEIVLIERGIQRKVYLDTLDNASYLKKHLKLQGNWPLEPVTLICNKPHRLRSWLMFRLCGFSIASILTSVAVTRTGRTMVKRLWFYDLPYVQYFYEVAAIIYDCCRFIFLHE